MTLIYSRPQPWLAAVVVLTLLVGTGCARALGLLRVAPNPVQITVLATDAVDAALQLGEIVEQLRASSHKLALAKVLPLESDDVVQRAAIAFADAKDRGVVAMTKATSTLQIVAAAAPMIGEAAKIKAILADVSGVKSLGGTAGLLSGQLPGILTKATVLMKTLGAK